MLRYIFFIIGKIIERASEEQEFTKKLLSDYMTKILEICLLSQVNPYEMESAILTLKICMKRFGSWFGAHKSKIELFLVNFLFSQSINLVKMAAEAFIQLQQVSWCYCFLFIFHFDSVSCKLLFVFCMYL